MTAALKKFAPHYRVHVVRSLALARQALDEAQPALLIVDFDPPLAGLIDFLEQLRNAVPETRVIVIAAGLPPSLQRADRPGAAITFIEKPFRLTDLGASIQALLSRADEDAPATALSQLNLSDILPLLGLEGANALVTVSAADQAVLGQLHFAHGRLYHAAANGLEGMDALREMLRWPSPEFACLAPPASAPVPTIEGKWPAVLAEAQRSIPRSPASQPPPPAPPEVVRDGKKILVIDDTETLRIFVEEMLQAAHPSLQIVSAATGAEGVEQCLSFRPDLILLDYSLPDFNGDEVCRRLAAHRKTRSIPIIMMSGHVAEMAQTAATYEGIVLTLAKPFISAALVDVVTQTLAHLPQRKSKKSVAELPEVKHEANGHALGPPAPSAQEDTEEESAPAQPIQSSPTEPPALTPARLPLATRDAVVVSMTLAVGAMQFSDTFELMALQAQLVSNVVRLHVDPRAHPGTRLPQTTFEIDRATLDEHGRIETLRLAPAVDSPSALLPHTGVPIAHLSIMPTEEKAGVELTPGPDQPMALSLLAAFDLQGVELSPSFRVAHLLLKARSSRVRAVLPGTVTKPGMIFETTRIGLNPEGRISEIALRAIPR